MGLSAWRAVAHPCLGTPLAAAPSEHISQIAGLGSLAQQRHSRMKSWASSVISKRSLQAAQILYTYTVTMSILCFRYTVYSWAKYAFNVKQADLATLASPVEEEVVQHAAEGSGLVCIYKST